MFKTITTSPIGDQGKVSGPLPAEALAENETEILRLKALGKTDGVVQIGPIYPTMLVAHRTWDTEESAQEWITFLENIHIKYEKGSLISAVITPVS